MIIPTPNRLGMSLTLATLACMLAACTGAGSTARDARPRHARSATAPARLTPIQHIVFIRLKDPLDTGALVDACNRLAADIPTVRSAFVGLHEETGRDTVVHDYDVCLIVGFDDQAGYRAYLEHPVHLSLLGAWRPRIEWLRIYDAHDVAP